MRAPLSDIDLHKAWDDLCMVGDPDSARPAVRLVVECAARALREREQARVPPPVDGKRRAANDFD
ncbi:hypothetical protein [Burkholderia cepacia]|uniref:hypothetical protein n=1 Tax=Burkholderia cepacia TaxID=292 RepID=UPI00075E3DAC|nr:hypothetical protein [Burkholderia cepacia]KVU55390.1 hypothetical protein WK70_21775 [Burkholderia cepacia]